MQIPGMLLKLMNDWKENHEAAYDFTEDDQITHRVWVIDNQEIIGEIREEFEGLILFISLMGIIVRLLR